MFAIVGLGNPGAEYANTRHNAGAWVIEELHALLNPNGWQRKFGCRFAKGKLATQEVLLGLPEKYMNRSGEALEPLLSFFKLTAEQLVVVHDELDLDVGIVRFKKGGGAGGHRGLQDIIRVLGTGDFYRVRIGIGHPRRCGKKEGSEANPPSNPALLGGRESGGQEAVSDWVLSKPGPEEKELLVKAVLSARSALEVFLTEGLEAAQRRAH